MKITKRITLTVIVLALMLAVVLGLVACGAKPVQIRDSEIILTYDKDVMADIENKTLLDYMNALQEKELLTFSAPGGFVVTMNDRTPDATKGEYWFIYTDDEDYSNEAWGTYEIEGKTYKSATKGISELPIKEGKSYIFVISVYEA